MTEKAYQGPIFALLIFLVVGAALAGTPGATTEPEYITINSECDDYGGSDDDNDGDSDLIEDQGCHAFPYSSGDGESGTNPNAFDNTLNYQPYYDLTVDYVRNFVTKACGGNLAGCVGTNFANEVQFYCYFSTDMMSSDFYSVFDKHFNQFQYLPDDGSLAAYQNTCQSLPPSPTTLQLIEYQASSPIASNPGGSNKGGSK